MTHLLAPCGFLILVNFYKTFDFSRTFSHIYFYHTKLKEGYPMSSNILKLFYNFETHTFFKRCEASPMNHPINISSFYHLNAVNIRTDCHIAYQSVSPCSKLSSPDNIGLTLFLLLLPALYAYIRTRNIFPTLISSYTQQPLILRRIY